jgi:hypothetical protein
MSTIKTLIVPYLLLLLQSAQALDSINAHAITRSLNVSTSLPNDISFCIADLKYSKKNGIKICELGQGLVSGFAGHQALHGPGKVWAGFWASLKKIDLPFYFLINNAESLRRNASHLALEEMLAAGGNIIYSLHDLPQNIQVPTLIIPHMHPRILPALVAIKKKQPNLIILDENTRSFVLNKLYTHLLFAAGADTEFYRPKCVVSKKKYTPTLHKEIGDYLGNTDIVIKPINAWKGDGIIMTHQKQLNYHLHKLFDGSCPFSNAYTYWKKDTSTHFLAENLMHSDPITVNNKKYDATMRVAFTLAHNNGSIQIDFLGAYWKLPDQPLNEKASLESRFKSHIGASQRRICSAVVDSAIYTAVTKQLKKALPPVYTRMLAAKKDSAFMKMLSELCKPTEQKQ